jgi:hypothetical protein
MTIGMKSGARVGAAATGALTFSLALAVFPAKFAGDSRQV